MKYQSRVNRNKKKARKNRTPFTGCLIFFIILLVLLLAGGGWVFAQFRSGLQPVEPENYETVEVEIPDGATVDQIGQILEDQGLIKDASIFRIYSRLEADDAYYAGYYTISPSESVAEISDKLEAGGDDVAQDQISQISIPEGTNMLQLADIIAEATSHSADEVLDLLEDDEFHQRLYEAYPQLLEGAMEVKEDTLYTLEGYLYPATYDLSENTSLEDLITNMVAKSDEEYSAYYDQIADSSFSLHEVLTLASFVEREASNDEDRRLIASVFLNRLDIDMMLQTDVSVAYAQGEHLEYTTLEDADIDSPYNLYRNYGMGPGPTNNCSVDSVDAVLNPADTDYFYFLADIETEETYFSETFEEHLEKQAIYVDRTAEPPAEESTSEEGQAPSAESESTEEETNTY